MKKSHRLVSILLCILLMLAAASCAATPTTTGTAPTTTQSGTTATPTSSEKDYSEKMVISLASIQIMDGMDYNYGDDWVKKWTSEFNVEWEITSLTWENWAERLRTWINAQDMPDWCVWNYAHGEAVNYTDQGLLKELPGDWKSNWPNLAAAYQNTVMNEKMEDLFDGTYFLFRPVFALNRPSEKLSLHLSFYLREDWGKTAGVTVKDAMKISEIIEYARAVKTANPGGIDNFYPIVSRPGLIGIGVMSTVTYSGVYGTPFYQGDDGKYHWGPADQETLNALKLYKQMYDEGLLHPEFYTLKDPDDVSAFYMTGKAAAIVSEGMAARMTQYNDYMAENLKVNFEDAVRVVIPVDESGVFHGTPVTNFWCANIFSPDIDDEKFERLLDIMDYSCTDEAQLSIRMGIKGKDWEQDANGNLINKLPAGTILNNTYAIHPVYGNMMILSDDFQFLNPQFYEQYRNKVKTMYEMRDQLSTDESLPAEPDWTVQLYSSQVLNLASMVYTDEYASLITKAGDLTANWQAWVNEKMPMIQPVLDELNAKN